MKYEITIPEVLQSTLEAVAQQGGRNPQEFVQFIIDDILQEKYKKAVVAKIETATFEELTQIDDVVTQKKEEIATIKAEAEKAKIEAEIINEKIVEEKIIEEIVDIE